MSSLNVIPMTIHMKTTLMIAAGLLAAIVTRAQSADSQVTRAVQLEHSMHEAEALTVYKQILARDSQNLKALARASILLTREGMRQKASRDGKSFYLQARSLSDKALRVGADDKEANLSMALALQQLSYLAGAKEKAAYIRDVKTYTDKALMIDSSYAAAWRVLGSWNYQVSSLGFAERAATKLLFGSLPAASIEEAIADFRRSHELDPSSIRSLYELAKTYHANGQDRQAMATLTQAIRLRPILQDDRGLQAQCRKMLEGLQ